MSKNSETQRSAVIRADGGGTWHERGDVALEVLDTEVGREVSIYDLGSGEQVRKYTLPAGDARILRDLLNEVFPDP